ncbi:hypothetical protein EYF80_005692 [Liparis tanakae]|uniref:Uncharacterized protein n=1 Tax=Liparis tanakae TaxID=230148 RepID=A0A4Z2J1N1_9TELE|nr:hypothetical protein EYF80_005692 [Liparis tanakae]
MLLILELGCPWALISPLAPSFLHHWVPQANMGPDKALIHHLLASVTIQRQHLPLVAEGERELVVGYFRISWGFVGIPSGFVNGSSWELGDIRGESCAVASVIWDAAGVSASQLLPALCTSSAARRPAHKERSLSYDIKGIVERSSAQQPPYMGSLCKERTGAEQLLTGAEPGAVSGSVLTTGDRADATGQYRLLSGLQLAYEPIRNRTCHGGTESWPDTTHIQPPPPLYWASEGAASCQGDGSEEEASPLYIHPSPLRFPLSNVELK